MDEEVFDDNLLSEKEEKFEVNSDGDFQEEEPDDLNMKAISTKAWLVKLPKFLATKWSEMERDDADLGRVRIFNDETSSGRIKLILSDIDAHADIPKEYDLTIMNQEVKDTYSFFQEKDHGGKDTGAVTMQATIHHNCHIRPTLGGEYSRKLRERTLEAGQPKRHIKMIDENENRGAYVPPGASGMAIAKFGNLVQKRQKVSTDQKTTRMPKNELIDQLFRAFEQYAYWTLRGLKDYVRQPESYLKDVLTEIAILDKRGSYNNCYHLKPEYKRETQATHDAIAPAGLEPSAIIHTRENVSVEDGDEEVEGEGVEVKEEEEEEEEGGDSDLELFGDP